MKRSNGLPKNNKKIVLDKISYRFKNVQMYEKLGRPTVYAICELCLWRPKNFSSSWVQ